MKVLIAGNLFHDYEYSIQRAFQSLGHQADLCFLNFEGPFYPGKSTFKWLKYGALPIKLGVDAVLNYDKARHNRSIRDLLRKSKYDLLLIIKGLSIEEETLTSFEGKKVLWVLDSISRFDSLHPILKHFDYHFSYEQSDIKYASQSLDCDMKYLPVGADEKKYQPLTFKMIYDLSFVGGRKPNRDEFLKKIGVYHKLALIGDFNKSEDAHIRSCTIAKSANHKTINQLYNQSKFNLNIHKPQNKESVNPRFFEILAAGGGVQLVEPKAALRDVFIDGKDLIYYTSLEELEDKIAFYQSRESLIKEIAVNGQEKVMKAHTWTHRIDKLLTYIQ